MSSLKEYFSNLNAFEPDPNSGEIETEQQHRFNIIATRIYLILLVVLLIVFTGFLLVSSETVSVSIHKPTEKEFQAFPLDAQCFCSRISIPYGEFISFQPMFHQVCSSDFVTDKWIKAIFNGSNPTSFYYADLRIEGSAQFQALASFCTLSKVEVLQSVASFGIDTLVSTTALSRALLQSKIGAFLEQFQSTAYQTFASQLKITRNMTRVYQLLSGLQTHTILLYFSGLSGSGMMDIYLGESSYSDSNGFPCDCLRSVDCQYLTSIYDLFGVREFMDYFVESKHLMSISGIVGGCLPVDGMLLSTLLCLYNQTCIDQIVSLLSPLNSFTALNSMAKSRFNINTTVQSIVDNLMVEDWRINISYENYYDQCAPKLCTYSIAKHNDFIFVLAKIIGSLGSLTLLLKLLIPPVLRFIKRPRNNEPTQVPRIPMSIRMRQLLINIKKIVIELNLFKQHRSNDRQMRYQRIASRLYILLIILSLIILTIYSSLTTVNHRQTIYNPTESQYIDLQQNYSDTLSCPCNTIIIPHSEFITIQPHYHQVCSSDMVSERWIQYLQYTSWYSLSTAGSQYRYFGSTQFRLLSQLCQQSLQTINDALPIFLKTQFLTSQVVFPILFDEEVNLLIQNWQSATTNQFVRTIQLFRSISQANQLSDGRSNVNWNIDYTTYEPVMNARMYSNCSCGLSQSCRAIMVVYNINDDPTVQPPRFRVPNFFTDCFPFEGLLASTLECFYNRSCMVDIDTALVGYYTGTFDFIALNSSLNIESETIGTIANRLMLDSWSSNFSFSSYYNTCAPLSCTFEYKDRNNAFAIFTTIITVFSGLSLGYKLLILITLQLIKKIQNGLSYTNLKNFIKNLFSCHNEHQVVDRLHVLFVLLTLCVLYSFISLLPRTVITKIPKPMLHTYMDLLTYFSDSLECSCTEISIRQNTFLNISPQFHQICSSDFVSDDWISYLYNKINSTVYFVPNDYINEARKQFQILASFCQLCQETAHNMSLQFVEGNIITSELLSPNSLDERIRTNVNQFRATVPNLFRTTLFLIHQTIGANMIMSALATNWRYIDPDYASDGSPAYTAPVVYGECNCGTSMKCLLSYGNMLKGCYLFEALLQWPLQCLYDQQCIDPTETFKAMNKSASSFSTNATVESIVSQLMVEEYSVDISYEKYFAKCLPSSCSYTYVDKNNAIEGITNLIALYGGLVILCGAIAKLSVKIFWRLTKRIVPVTN